MATYKMPGETKYANLVLEAGMPPKVIDQIRDMTILDGDTLIATYAKAGSTWTQELTWLIYHQCDITRARAESLADRSKYLELKTIPSYNGKTGYELIRDRTEPHVMKTHLPAWIFPKQIEEGKVKILVVIRNPKDTMVSLYHFYQANLSLGQFTGTWDEFFELVKTKHVLLGDYFEWYASWIPYLQRDNVMLLSYEEMSSDLPASVRKIAKFLGKELDDDQVVKIADHCSFDSMKENPATNPALFASGLFKSSKAFMRKGKVGDWKNYFNKEQNDYVDERYEQILKRNGITLSFE